MSAERVELSPIPMILFCPACGLQHIDAPSEVRQVPIYSMPANVVIGYKPTVDWENPPHRSHLCAACGHIWRPADLPTEGVASIGTRGAADAPAIREHAFGAIGDPVAWRYRYLYDKGPSGWTVRQTPARSQAAAGYVAIEAQPLFARLTPAGDRS